MKPILILLLSIFSLSCQSQINKNDFLNTKVGSNNQIAEYVTSAYQDSQGHLWFGTLQKGIAKYDGTQLKYFSTTEGLPSERVTGIFQDKIGDFWLNTGAGLAKYDGKVFTNFLIGDDFFTNTVSNLLIDRNGTYWVGTWGGVFIFDGKKFTPFALPFPFINTPINQDTKNWITGIKEDPEGNIWFLRDGYGICKYDRKEFTHILKKDGLHSNNVTDVEFGNDGSIWISTRVAEKDNPDPEKRVGAGGLNRLTDNKVISFPEIEGLNREDVYTLYKDRSGDLWISTINNGVYRYDGESFVNYDVPVPIMSMNNDADGYLWLCGAGGLYRINEGGEVQNITQDGPWK